MTGRFARIAVLFAGAAASVLSASAADALRAGFANPPNRAKPRVWWHWMNGNVTKPGITADLEAMAQAGIGGAHVFDVGCDVPPGPVKFATPVWDEHLLWAIGEAERLGLELTLVNCSGYANAGGPWVAPSNSMFFVTHSETVVKDGGRFAGKLPRATRDNGFYRDIATLAFPRPKCETDVPADFAVTSPATNVFVFSASKPYALRGLSFAVDLTGSWAWSRTMKLAVEKSDDGRTWTACGTYEFPVVEGGKSDCDAAQGQSRLAAFPEVRRAQHLRFTADLSKRFHGSDGPVRLAWLKPVFRRALPALNHRVFRMTGEIDSALPRTLPGEAVDPTRIIDLTAQVGTDGTLDWTPPAGRDWVVVRLGYQASGVICHPCSTYGGGLEVDKLDAAAVAKHLEAYALRYAKHKGVVSVLCDSYEVGSQNWTHGFERQFEAREGYSIVPFLAVALSGRVLASVKRTDDALADYRRLIADLFAENFAGTFAKKCGERGLTAALEPYGNGPFDDLAYGWRATQPMTEFWVDRHVGASLARSGHYARLAKEVASAAHLKGIPTVDAEGFTAFPTEGGRWTKDPFGLKAMGDLMYAHGVTRMVYHRWAHQPWTEPVRLPGMTMGQWGTHFERTETWWPMVGPWLKYQARCQYLLQEGAMVADILVFAGDDVPRRRLPEDLVPRGIDWDICGKDALARLTVREGGRLACYSATTYAALVVPTNVWVSPASAQKIAALKEQGATVVADLKGEDFPVAPDFLAPEPLLAIHRRYREGREAYFVVHPETNATVVTCSFRVDGKVPQLWDPETGAVVVPRTWCNAETPGASCPEGRTQVEIAFKPCGAVFVMFVPAEAPEASAAPRERRPAVRRRVVLNGSWTLSFPRGWNCPDRVGLTNLVSWTDIPEGEIRYFSGIAEYAYAGAVPLDSGTLPKGSRLVLELGDVRNLAEVTVNGRTFAPLWRPPFEVDVTEACRGGAFDLRVRVANLWPNRLIGDAKKGEDRDWSGKALKEIPAWVNAGRPSPTGRLTFTTWRHWYGDEALLPSGLLGPVALRVVEEK